MNPETRDALVGRLAVFGRLIEVGVGHRTTVAAALADRGCAVTATDVRDRSVPARVSFVRDDVTDPDPAVYADADAIYGLNLPPDLHHPTRALARRAGVPLFFTTLGADQPAVPVDRETLPGETLYVVAGDGAPTRRGRREPR